MREYQLAANGCRTGAWSARFTNPLEIHNAYATGIHQSGPPSAFDYRGDVTLTLKSGAKFEAYIFNRQTGTTLADSYVQYFTPSAPEKRKVSYAEIARLEFSGKDRAAGKHWEDWVKAYNERKAAGEKGIALHPDKID